MKTDSNSKFRIAEINPYLRISKQMTEVLMFHKNMNYSNAKNESIKMIKYMDNLIKIDIIDKVTKEKVPINIDLLITKTMSDDSNLNLKDENFTKDKNIYTTNFSLNEETNWIITGSFKVEDETGFIFIKTNAK